MLHHWSNSDWLHDSAQMMQAGWSPPHSSLLFRKHKSQRGKLPSALSLCTSLWKTGWWHAQLSQPGEMCPITGGTFWAVVPLLLCQGTARTEPDQEKLLWPTSMPLQLPCYFISFKWIQLFFFVPPPMRHGHTQRDQQWLPTYPYPETSAHQATLCESELAKFCNFPQLPHACTQPLHKPTPNVPRVHP